MVPLVVVPFRRRTSSSDKLLTLSQPPSLPPLPPSSLSHLTTDEVATYADITRRWATLSGANRRRAMVAADKILRALGACVVLGVAVNGAP